ncbi:MAG: hypothetical protein V1722_04760 [Candidatus Micrarchaeota archaeon]
MIYFKKHLRNYSGRTSVVIAMADINLIGKRYSEGGKVLDLKTYGAFYTGEKITAAKASEVIKVELEGNEYVSFNFVGKEAITVAGKFFNVKNSKKIAGIPHLQVYRV